VASPAVLLIDDDEGLRGTVSVLLEQEGFQVLCAADGRTGFELAVTGRPDLMIVDLRLPGMSGLDICRQIRASGSRIPLIILSAVVDEVDKVLLLEIGADDYVVKPFGARELLARIRAVLRRAAPQPARLLHFDEVQVDLDRRAVMRAGQEIKFTPSEYNLLTFFLQHPDRPLSRDMLLNSVWGYESFPNARTVDVHVLKLRQKLETDPAVPKHFLTLHGVGYRFIP
jgi:DNA-binding response OmpR family regulator